MKPSERIASIISTISIAGGAGEQVDLWALGSELSDIGQQVEEMQKALEWYAGDEIAEIVRRYYFGETICEAIGQRAKVTLQSLKGDTQ